jgi:hypothetical protein
LRSCWSPQIPRNTIAGTSMKVRKMKTGNRVTIRAEGNNTM